MAAAVMAPDATGHSFSDQEIAEFRQVFAVFDKDSDNHITTAELGDVMRHLKLQPTEDELRDLLAEVDEDKNGTIEFDEFIHLMARKMRDNDTEEELKSAFNAFAQLTRMQVFDRDGDGFISVLELKEVMESLGETLTEKDISLMMKDFDSNGDGLIDYNEFRAMMR
ncbi:hypothetical protein HDU83_005857 [Entophlyctis luteolus]|nr:hypothetical protein HDU83_005857 [Entophlyctis luteolus]